MLFKVVLFCLWIAPALFAADGVRVEIKPEQAPPGSPAGMTTVATYAVFPAAEEKSVDSVVAEVVRTSRSENPGVPVGIACGASAAECESLSKAVGETGAKDVTQFPIEKTPATVKLPSEWKLGLAVIRTIVNGVVVGVTIGVARQNIMAGVLGGLLTAVWSGWWQYKNTERLDWQASNKWLKVSTAEKAGILLRYSKRAAFTAAYAVLLSAAIVLTAHEIEPELATNMLKTVGQSLLMQTPLESVNKELRDRATQRNPERAYIHRRVSGVATLIQSAIAVTTNAMNVMGVSAGNIISLSVAAVGYVAWGAVERKAIANAVQRYCRSSLRILRAK